MEWSRSPEADVEGREVGWGLDRDLAQPTR